MSETSKSLPPHGQLVSNMINSPIQLLKTYNKWSFAIGLFSYATNHRTYCPFPTINVVMIMFRPLCRQAALTEKLKTVRSLDVYCYTLIASESQRSVLLVFCFSSAWPVFYRLLAISCGFNWTNVRSTVELICHIGSTCAHL